MQRTPGTQGSILYSHYLKADADGDDAVHTGFAGAGDDGVELPLKLREIKMSVSVGEHGHYQRTTDEAQVKPPPKTTMRM